MTRRFSRRLATCFAAAFVVAASGCEKPGPYEGYGVLDRSAYEDAGWTVVGREVSALDRFLNSRPKVV